MALGAFTRLPLYERWQASLVSWFYPHAGFDRPLWLRLTTVASRHPVSVLATLDGDTFLGRVVLPNSPDLTLRVRLRGIDAPEMDAHCAAERQGAEAATAALRRLLRDGGVTIYDIGPDPYEGRAVARVATRVNPDLSQTLLGLGLVRPYHGGHRQPWCPPVFSPDSSGK